MTLAQLVTEIKAWLDRTDISDAQIYTFINSSIRTMEELYDFKHMRVKYEHSLSEDDYVFSNPLTNYKKLDNALFIYDSNGYKFPITRVFYDYAIKRYPDLTNNIGRPVYLCRTVAAESSLSPDISPTDQWMVRPTCDTSYTLEFNGLQYSPELDGSTYTTNWWTANAWNLIRFAALEEAALFIGDAAIASAWANKKNELFISKMNSEILEEVSGMDTVIQGESISMGAPRPYANDYVD